MNGHDAASVHVLRHVPIPMSDGVVLSADLYLPHADALVDGVERPVVFDFYPYRKDDLMRGRERAHRLFAARGMVAARLDVRGSGSSGGIAADEYSEAELADGVEAIAWFADRPWSNGRVGMFGSSYGGFNALQVAMRRPPALRAICPMYFTDNRYTDDCHYKGGSLQMLYDIGSYGLSMVPLNALPPSRDALGEDWARVWQEHLRNEPWLLNWLEHQTYDDYWKHGSLCEDYGSIEAATYLFGGWRDGYATCNLRTFEHLRCPKKVLVGPWTHTWPDAGVPGPKVDHLDEHARWFEHWLMDVDNGIADEPPVTVYVQRFDPPAGLRTQTSGSWRHEAGWPLDRSSERRWHLRPDGLLGASPPPAAGRVPYLYNPTVGTTFGIFAGSSGLPLVPPDQRLEAGHSTSWTSEPLEAPVEILGRPGVDLRVVVSAPVATVVVRLIDVAPDGAAALVTKGMLNLTHRDSHEAPEPVVPDEPVDVHVDLEATSWLFDPGHRIQVAITGSDYPYLWPSPLPYEAAVLVGPGAPSALSLPVLAPQEPALPAPTLRPPSAFQELPGFQVEPPAWRVTRDHVQGAVEVFVRTHGITRMPDGSTARSRSEATTRVAEGDPAHASVRGECEVELRSPTRTVVALARGEIASDATTLHVTVQLDLRVDDVPFHARQWSRSYPRRLL